MMAQQLPEAPTQVQLLVTERCNLKCLHCAVPAEDSPADHELSTEEWMRCIDGLAAAGVCDLTISGGEALLRRDAVVLLRHACQSPIPRVMLVTNAVQFLTRWSVELVKLQQEFASFHLHVSIDGASADTHDWLRGTGTFEASMNGLREFRARGGVIDGVQTVIHQRNVHELEEFAFLVRDLGAREQVLFPLAEIGRGVSAPCDPLRRDQWEMVHQAALRLAEEHAFGVSVMGPVLGDEWPGEEGCLVPTPRSARPDRVVVGPDGDVFCCPPLREVSLGSVQDFDGPGSVADVAERLRCVTSRECHECRFRYLCTGVQLPLALVRVPQGTTIGDPGRRRDDAASVVGVHVGRAQ